jgi:hypothetical protein
MPPSGMLCLLEELVHRSRPGVRDGDGLPVRGSLVPSSSYKEQRGGGNTGSGSTASTGDSPRTRAGPGDIFMPRSLGGAPSNVQHQAVCASDRNCDVSTGGVHVNDLLLQYCQIRCELLEQQLAQIVSSSESIQEVNLGPAEQGVQATATHPWHRRLTHVHVRQRKLLASIAFFAATIVNGHGSLPSKLMQAGSALILLSSG